MAQPTGFFNTLLKVAAWFDAPLTSVRAFFDDALLSDTAQYFSALTTANVAVTAGTEFGVVTRVMPCVSASIAVTGGTTAYARSINVALTTASVAVTSGTEYSVAQRRAPCTSENVAVTGGTTVATATRCLAATTASVAVTEGATGAQRSRNVVLTTASVAVTAGTAVPVVNRRLAVTSTSISVTGGTTIANFAHQLAVTSATVSVTEGTAVPVVRRRLGVTAATVSVTAGTEVPVVDRRLELSAVTFSVTAGTFDTHFVGQRKVALTPAVVNVTLERFEWNLSVLPELFTGGVRRQRARVRVQRPALVGASRVSVAQATSRFVVRPVFTVQRSTPFVDVDSLGTARAMFRWCIEVHPVVSYAPLARLGSRVRMAGHTSARGVDGQSVVVPTRANTSRRTTATVRRVVLSTGYVQQPRVARDESEAEEMVTMLMAAVGTML